MLSADLAFVDTQAKATVRVMTHPDFERDVAPVRSIVREGDEHPLTTCPADWPFLWYQTQNLQNLNERSVSIRRAGPENKGEPAKIRPPLF